MSPLHLQIRLRQLRETAGLTQIALAELAGVSQRAISDLETGKTQRIDLELLDRVSRALRVDPGALFRRVKA